MRADLIQLNLLITYYVPGVFLVTAISTCLKSTLTSETGFLKGRSLPLIPLDNSGSVDS